MGYAAILAPYVPPDCYIETRSTNGIVDLGERIGFGSKFQGHAL
jgi:hypothetical protein